MTSITPLDYCDYYSSLYGINLYIKRDDLYPFTGGSSKARKIQFILRDIIEGGYNALVSAGSAESNHARVVSLVGAQYGWPVTVVIHDDGENIRKHNHNMKIMEAAGAKLICCDLKEVKGQMDHAMEDYLGKGYKPYYIYGGAHNLLGVHAFYMAYLEVVEQIKFNINHIVLASGTGSSQAGLIAAAGKLEHKTRIQGISVSRDKYRGKVEIENILVEYCRSNNLDLKYSSIYLYDDFLFGGYGKTNEKLDKLIKEAAKNSGLLLEPTYTAKAFYGLTELVKDQIIKPDDNVVFWHSGSVISTINNYL